MTCWRDVKAGRSFVYVAQRGKFRELFKRQFTEDDTQFANKVTVHEGEGGKVLAEIPLTQPRGLANRGRGGWDTQSSYPYSSVLSVVKFDRSTGNIFKQCRAGFIPPRALAGEAIGGINPALHDSLRLDVIEPETHL
jgi:hypothetical protein